MDKKITGFLVSEYKIGKWKMAPIDILLILAAAVFALMLRLSVVSYKCLEFTEYLKIANKLKLETAVFDLLLALLSGLYVYELTAHKRKALLTYAIVLMLPVLCAGSAMWGFGDSIYVFFALLSLYLLGKEKGNLSLVCFGISIFLSRYVFFLLPIYAIAFMKKKNKLIFFLFPLCGVWFRNGLMSGGEPSRLSIFEADRLMRIMHGNEMISFNWPNLYQMIGADKFVSEYSIVGKCVAAVLMLVIVVAALQRNRELTKDRLLSVALTLSLLFPFIMPGMDERCGLLADILAVVFVMKHMDMFYIAVIQIIISYIAYSAYFRGSSVIPLSAVSFVSLFLILVMLYFTGSGKKLTIGDLSL